ncbi:Vault protein inter-alpha-trypsin domain [Branchiostoma belcheri]|nr:Vault protein inter-alpha-trypsin domain [Branchiostoma belcheri]
MSAILFATRSLPNALNKEIVGDLSHIARCRSVLGPGSVEIGGCDVMKIYQKVVCCWAELLDVPVDAMFVYPVDESCVVVGFEALVGGRTISLQLKDGPSISREATPSTSQEQFSQDDWLYRQTAFIVDEHETREIFTVNIGSLPAYETATVLVSISSEIRNGKNGALRCTLPHICTPRFRNQSFELVTSPEDSKSSLTSTNYSMGYGTEDASFSTCRNLMDIVQETAINPFPYEFEFQLEVKMPCLLAGVESPTHSIRVDADPYARNANEVFVTLAEQHTYSEDVQVLLYLSDPHKPAIILEHGDMSLSGYEEYVKSRRSFKRLQREKDEKPSSKVDYLRSRLHKDLMHHAAIMLSFFPDFSSIPPRDPSKIPGNFIFILDRSGSMSGANIAGARETLLLFLKSLPTCCLFNIVSFGSSYKPMFSNSVAYTQQNVDKASADIKKMRADMGGTNILAPLQWVFSAPVTSGYPRQVFLLTDGSVSNTGTVIDIVRKNAYNTRCFALGIGPKASRPLVQGVGSAGGGAAELIQEGERIQPKVVSCLKRALQPCISDITVTWRPPAGIEVLQSPKSLPPLFPGDRLVAYAVLYDMLVVEPRPKDEEIEETTEGSSSTVSQSTTSDFSEAASSVNTGDLLRDIVDEISSKKKEKHENELREPVRKIRKISDLGKSASMGPRSPEREFLSEVGGEENGAHIRKRGNSLEVPDLSRSNRTRKISGQGGSDIDLMMLQRMLGKLFETGGQGMEEFKVTKLSPNDENVSEETAEKSKKDAKERPQDQPSSSDADGAGSDADSSDSRTEDRQPKQNGVTLRSPLSPKSRDMSVDDFLASVQKHGDWTRRGGKSKAVIKGLVFDEEFVYEIPFDVSEAIDPDRPTLDPEDNIWDETIHQLAARSIILDLEERLQRSEKSVQPEGSRCGCADTVLDLPPVGALCPETVLDEARAKIVHTSQSANIISRYTSFCAVDEDTNESLPSLLEQRLPLDKQPRSSNRRSGFSAGLGRRTSSMESEEDDSFHLQDTKGHAADSISLRSAPTSGFIAGRRRDSAVSSISMALPRRRSKRRQSSSQSKLFRSRFGSFGSRKLGGTPSARPLYKAYASKSLTPEVVTLAILVDLQLACGAWRMDALLAKALGVSLEQLQRSNPMVTPKKVLNLACDSRICLQPFQTVKSHRITKKRQRQMKHGALKESGRRRHERSSPDQNGEQNGKTSSSDETMQVEKTNSEILRLSEQIQKLSLDVELDEVYQKAHAQPKSRGRSMSVTICEFDRSPTSPSSLPSNQQRRKSLSDGFGPIIPFDPEGRRMQITHPKLEPIIALAVDGVEHRVAPKKPKRSSVCEAMATKEKGQESSENGQEPEKSEAHPPKDSAESETRERTNSNTSTRSTGSVRFKNVDDPEAEADRTEGVSKWKYDSRRSSAFSVQSGASYTSEASQADGGRGSSGEESPCPEAEDNTESMAWATALVLSWLESKCSSYLQEWDLLAAKAITWLSDLSPQLPKGFDAGSVRTSAAQALVLLQSKDGKDGKVINKKTQSTRL